jgi:hypothetical protein
MGEFTFKRLVDSEQGRSLTPVSTNPAHEAILLNQGDEIEALARFLAVLSEGGE